MLDVLQFEFMRNALLAGLLASISCGVIGTLIVVNRLVFLAGGVAHSAYGGIGLSLYFGWPYMIGATLFSLASAMIMATVTLKSKQRSDTIIGVMWAVGMATGIILIDMTPGYNVELMSYLFGSILSVPQSDLIVMAGLTAMNIALVSYYYKDLLVMSYDEEFAKVRGIPVKALYFMLVGMVAVTVVIVVQVVGLILVIALLTIPPYIAEKYTSSLLQMMIASSILGMIFISTGLWASYVSDLTSGATIILVAGVGFFLSILFDKIILIQQRKLWRQAHRID